MTIADRADLRGADLRGADLTCSDLRGADLRHAHLADAVLAQAVVDRRTRWPARFRPAAHELTSAGEVESKDPEATEAYDHAWLCLF